MMAANGKVRFLNLSVGESERKQYLAAIDKILAGGMILNGPEVETFEREVAAFCGANFAVGCGSGTAALYLALKCLHAGPGDEVVLPALSFVGTANAIAAVGAKPVFVDIRDDMLIDPARVEEAITPHTKAIMPVHFNGMIGDMAALAAIAARHNIPIVEDAAPAFGAIRQGRKAGTFGPLGCFSMNPMKVLGGIGEGGIVIAETEALAERLRELRYHGMRNKEVCIDVSLNARLDTIQAAVLSIRLRGIDANLTRRDEVARRYAAHLSNVVEVPRVPEGDRHAWYCYAILCDRRNALAAALTEQGIECKIYHPMLMPSHPAHGNGDLSHLPVGCDVVDRILCLPIHEKISDAEVDRVAEAVTRFYGRPS
jgi:dTDP-4-amino-4,6-dideoxygalactose transaminase